MSPSAGFITAASGTVVPSATDEVVLQGAGSDASPTFSTLLPTTDNSYRGNIVAQDAAPHGFWMATFPNGGGLPSSGFMLDPLTGGSAADVHPYAVYLTNRTGANQSWDRESGDLKDFDGAGYTPRAYMSTTLTAANCLAVTPSFFYTMASQIVSNALGTSAFDHKDVLWAPLYTRRLTQAAPTGVKGYSTFMRTGSVARSQQLTLSVAGAATREWIVMGSVVLPWDGTKSLL